MDLDLVKAVVSGVMTVLSRVSAAQQARAMGRLKSFAEDLERRIARHEQRISDEQFGTLLNRALFSIAQDDRDFRIRVFAAILENSYSEDPATFPAWIMVNLVDALDTHHIHVLRLVHSLPKDDDPDKTGRRAVTFESVLAHTQQESQFHECIVVAVLSQLTQHGLLYTRPSGAMRGQAVFNLTPLGLVKTQAFWLSELGERFVQYVIEQPSDSTASGESPINQ